MPAYEFVAIDPQGNSVKGLETAKHVGQIAERLRRRGLTIIDIKEDLGWRRQLFEFLGLGERLPLSALVVLMRQFATMMSAGIPLGQTLQSLSSQGLDKRVDLACFEVLNRVNGGHSLSHSFEMQGRRFPALTVPLIRAGEVSGKLDEMLDRLASHLEKELALLRAWRQATIYPLILFVICSVVTLGLVSYVFPVFISMFQGLDIQLPILTRALITVTETVRNPVVFGPALVGAATGAIFFRFYFKSPLGRRQWDWFKLESPYFGEFYRQVLLSRLSRTLATLLDSGLPLLLALKISGASAGNSIVRDILERVSTELEGGAKFSSLLEGSAFFPQVFTQFIEAGEEVGRIPEMLERLADLLEEEVKYSLDTFTQLVEPTMIVSMGIIVLLVLVAVFQPIYQLMDLF